MGKSKAYWLTAFSNIYIKYQNNKTLVYDTQTGKYIENEDLCIVELMKELSNPYNLRCIECDENTIVNNSRFFRSFIEKGMGAIVHKKDTKKKPIQLFPVLNLQTDYDIEELSHKDHILEYLYQLNIYITSKCDNNCKYCDEYNRQYCCCKKDNATNGYMELSTVRTIAQQIQNCPEITCVNLLGGNPWLHPNLKEILKIFENNKYHTRLWTHISLCNSIDSKDLNLDIIVTFPVKIDYELIKKLATSNKYLIHFFVASEQECREANEIIKILNIKKYRFHPIYTKDNISFIKNTLFQSKDEIMYPPVNHRQIFAHQKINTNFFGMLSLNTNGDISVCASSPIIASIKNTNLIEAISKELSTNTLWRKTRQSKECTNCLYVDLCSSPSLLEYRMNINHICNFLDNDNNC